MTTARLCAEIWAQIGREDWSLVSQLNPISAWPMRLWNFERHYQFIGGFGGAGVGYTLPAAVGAALANRAHGRLTVNIQPDGDLMYAPGVLWTAAHHRIPLLGDAQQPRVSPGSHARSAYGESAQPRYRSRIDWDDAREPEHRLREAGPGHGLYAEGPIEKPGDLAPALARAIAVVKRGEPALLDVDATEMTPVRIVSSVNGGRGGRGQSGAARRCGAREATLRKDGVLSVPRL